MSRTRRSARHRRTFALAIALAAVVSVLAPAAPPTVPSAAAPDDPALPEALVVGDSMMHALAQPYGAEAVRLLGDRHSVVLETAECRRLIAASCRIGSRPAPTTALTVVQSSAGRYDRALVVGVGYNDSTTGPTGLDTAVDVLVAEALAQGIDHVVWLTYREAGPSASLFRAHNELLRAKAAADPRITIADWAARSATLPAGWFSSDGVHLGQSATLELADLIADTLDLLPPTSRCRIVAPGAPVIGPVAPSSGLTAVAGAALALQPARRPQLSCP